MADASSQNAVRVRFAPSPTGYLHMGGARTALFNWLYARHTGGTFVLRVEDTDEKRNTPEARQAIYDGLNWLGIDWDEGPEKGGDYGPYFQSQRSELYEKHLNTLIEKGLTYEDEGAVRFNFPRKEDVVVDDQIRGKCTFDLSGEPDMTIRRPNGSFIFHFVNVVDDLEMGITHVIRGEDHLSNTPKHIELFKALDATPPVYAHIPLILNPNGSKMSKRDEGAAVRYYVEHGYAPEAVRNYLCLLGWSPRDNREILEIDEVIELFDFTHINRRNARFDLEKCFWINGQYIQHMDLGRFRELSVPFLNAAGVPFQEDAYFDEVLAIVKEKIKHFNEIPEWVDYFFVEDFEYEEKAVNKRLLKGDGLQRVDDLHETLGGVSEEDWKAEKLEETFNALSGKLGIKTGELVHPARVSVSGRQVGPSLYHMLEVMGKHRVLKRLERTRERFNP